MENYNSRFASPASTSVWPCILANLDHGWSNIPSIPLTLRLRSKHRPLLSASPKTSLTWSSSRSSVYPWVIAGMMYLGLNPKKAIVLGWSIMCEIKIPFMVWSAFKYIYKLRNVSRFCMMIFIVKDSHWTWKNFTPHWGYMYHILFCRFHGLVAMVVVFCVKAISTHHTNCFGFHWPKLSVTKSSSGRYLECCQISGLFKTYAYPTWLGVLADLKPADGKV